MKRNADTVTKGSVLITLALALIVATFFLYGFIIEKNNGKLLEIAHLETERSLVHVLLQDTLFSDMNVYSTYDDFSSAYSTFSLDLLVLLESPFDHESKTVLTNLMGVTEKRMLEINAQIDGFKERGNEFLPGPYSAKAEQYEEERMNLYRLAVQLENLPIYYGDAWDISFEKLLHEVKKSTNRQTIAIEIMAVLIIVGLTVLIFILTNKFRKMFDEVDQLSKNLEIEISLRSAELNKALYELSITDDLTGLYNRRHFNDIFEGAWKICVREKKLISIIMIDIDYFKNYNDHYGHPAGDAALSNVASAIKNSLNRASDIAARYGGEEFIVLLPNTDSRGSFQIAETIRRKIADLGMEHGKSLVSPVLSVSMGVSTTCPAIGDNATDLIKKADDLLYRAKENGRDRIEQDEPNREFLIE